MFWEYLHILTLKRFSLKLQAKVYTSCVISFLIYGSEIWLMNEEHEVSSDRNEMIMIRWMCGFTLKGRKKNTELRQLLRYGTS